MTAFLSSRNFSYLLKFLKALRKIILSLFVTGPSVFSDEYVYSKLGWSIFNQGEYSIHGIGASSPVPLYPILLSISYIFGNAGLIYFFMKLLNILVLSATIFPIYFLAMLPPPQTIMNLNFPEFAFIVFLKFFK